MVALHRPESVHRVAFAHQPFVIGRDDERRGRTSGHDVGISSGAGPPGNQPAVVGIADERGRHFVGHFGPSQPPQDVEVPLREPEGVGIIHVMHDAACRIARERAGLDPDVARERTCALAVRQVGVFAVHVVDLVAAQQDMPQVGVEFCPLLLRAAFYLDASQPFVPFVLCRAAHGVEVPGRGVMREVLPCIFRTDVRYDRADMDAVARTDAVICRDARCGGVQVTQCFARVAPGDFGGAFERVYSGITACACPSVEPVERPVETDDEVNPDVLGAAPVAAVGVEAALDFVLPDPPHAGVAHGRRRQVTAQVQEYAGFGVAGEGQAVEPRAVSGRLLDPDAVILQEEAVVTRLGDFALVPEVRFPVPFAEGGIDVAGRRHERKPGQHPVVYLREAEHLGRIVVVAPAVLVAVAGQRCGADHAERLVARDEEEIAPLGRFDERVDLRDEVASGPGGRECLDLGEPDMGTHGVVDLEFHPSDPFGREFHDLGLPVVRDPDYSDTCAVAEKEVAACRMRIARRPVVEDDAREGDLLVPVEPDPGVG